MATSMNAADVIAARLVAAGVKTAFGIPGGEVLTLIPPVMDIQTATDVARKYLSPQS